MAVVDVTVGHILCLTYPVPKPQDIQRLWRVKILDTTQPPRRGSERVNRLCLHGLISHYRIIMLNTDRRPEYT
jgi:hypothetical protein